MEEYIANQQQWIGFLEIFIMMLVAFLIGYVFGIKKTKKKIAILTKENEERLKVLQKNKELYDIETIFTEIKPEIVKILETNKFIKKKKKKKRVIYSGHQVGILNFESFGHAAQGSKDDLTKINGVGPFIEEKLNNIGIFTFDQISKFTDVDIDTVTKMIDFFPGRIERDNWVKQAKKLKQKRPL